jgi:probable F420-dependent oxidoreductase
MGESINEVLEAAKAAEAGGFDTAWFPEFYRTAFVPTAVAATVTSRISLGTAVALAFVRSPLTLALNAIDLDEVSDGRFVLGLGTGVARLNQDWHNAHFGRPVRHLRETVSIVRRVVATSHHDEPIEIEGEDERIDLRGYRRPFPPGRPEIPIYVGSMGPNMSRLAGEIADGWIALEIGSLPHFRSEILPQIEAGLAAAGRERRSIELVASACCVIHPDSHEAKRRLAGLVAFYASVRTYTGFFAWHGFEREALTIQEHSRNGDTTGMIDACTDEMVDTFGLAGTPDQVRRKLQDYEGIVDSIKLTPPTHHLAPEATREAQQSILDLFST